MTDDTLYDTVIENDYCIGCGACSFAEPETYSVEFDDFGMYKAKLSDEERITGLNTQSKASKVCPFSDDSASEDQLAEDRFDEDLNFDERIGKYISCYAGHVEVGQFREKGSSGGFGKWLLSELLESGEVDYVIQVTPIQKEDEVFSYQVYEKSENILSGSKSAYYPVNLEDSLEFIKNNEGTYAITALPCFSKALQLLSKEDDIISERVEYILGLICGHLKSRAFAESFAWQLDVHPDDLSEIEFRGETQGEKANEKGVYAVDRNGEKSNTVSSRELIGGDWGHGLFKYKACDYCDDIVGETADVSFGDAWLDEYIDDPKGTSIIVTRDRRIEKVIDEGIQKGALNFDEVSAEKVAESQMGGIRHRREGLSYRLQRQQEKDNWAPEKRVDAERTGSSKRDKIYEKREELRNKSHKLFLEAKNKDDFEIFEKGIKEDLQEYDRLYSNRVKSFIGDLLDKIGMKRTVEKYYRRTWDQIIHMKTQYTK